MENPSTAQKIYELIDEILATRDTNIITIDLAEHPTLKVLLQKHFPGAVMYVYRLALCSISLCFGYDHGLEVMQPKDLNSLYIHRQYNS